MKKQLFTLFCLLFVVHCSFANIATDPILSFEEGTNKVLVLRVDAIDDGVQVVFQDAKGNLLFTDALKKGYKYHKKLKVANFVDGTYYLKLVEVSSVKYFKIIKGKKNQIVMVDNLPFEHTAKED